MAEDPWRTELDEHLSALHDSVMAVFQPWIDASADDPEGLLASARMITSSAVTDACQARVGALETWLCQKHNSLVEQAAGELGIQPRANWREHPDGALQREVMPEMRQLASDAAKARAACVELAEFIQSNSGVMGFAKNFVIGALDPVEGIAGLFGESSMDVEGRRLNALIEDAFGQADNDLTTFVHAVDAAVVRRWNSRTVGVLEEMERASSTASGRSDVTAVRHDEDEGSALVGWIAISVVGLVLLVGGAGGAWGLMTLFSGDESAEGEVEAPVADQVLVVVEPGPVFEGPGDGFAVTSELTERRAARLLDGTVPGWKKVALDDATTGWVPASRTDP